jgi:hypothetical protein
LEGRTDRGKTIYPLPRRGSGGIIRSNIGSKCVDLILIRLAKGWNNFFSSKFCIWLYCENGKYMIILWKCQVGIYFFLLSSQMFFFPMLDLIIPPLPRRGRGYIVLPLSVRPSKIFFVTFFSATIGGRNLIFGHKLHIGMPYRGKRFWNHQIPTSCLPT